MIDKDPMNLTEEDFTVNGVFQPVQYILYNHYKRLTEQNMVMLRFLKRLYDNDDIWLSLYRDDQETLRSILETAHDEAIQFREERA